MQGREVDAVLDLVHHLVADHHGPRELLAAVHRAVADRVDVAHRGDARDAGLGRDEPAQDVVEGGAVVAQRRRAPHRGLALDPEGDERLAADPLDQTPRASCRSAFFSIASRSVSMTWNLREELPVFRTSTFMSQS